jgi:hypothetical protein
MFGKTTRRLALAVGLAAVALTATQPAFAQDPEPLILPVGVACPDFNLGLLATGGKLHTREFTDAAGNVVRTISAGKGFDLTYTNYGTDPNNPVAGESVTVKTAGSVMKTVFNPDGTLTVTGTGHNGLILFPSDVPAGPTTTHYIGRIVYTVDPGTNPPETEVFTLVSTTGQERDICAELT